MQHNRIALLAIFGVLSGAPACGDLQQAAASFDAEGQPQQQPLTYAPEAGSQFAEVGHLSMRWTAKGKSKSGSCSGVLIAPDVVLTASHCVPGWLDGNREETEVSYFSTHPEGVPATQSPRRIVHWVELGQLNEFVLAIMDNLWGGSDSEAALSDLALAVLDQPMGDAHVAALPRTPMQSNSKVGYLGVGYGIYRQGWFSMEYGRRHFATLVADQVRPTAFRSGKGSARICKGDSGGAVLRDRVTHREVVGIFSHSDSLLRSLFSPCSPHIWATRVDVHTESVEAALRILCEDGVRDADTCAAWAP